MKVILNKCYGGFGISDAGYQLYAEKKGIKLYRYVWDFGNVFRLFKGGDPGGKLIYYFTKDYGDSYRGGEADWGDMLYLDMEHRADPVLVEVVEELGKEANGRSAKLVIVDIPDGMDYVIDEYDGAETLHQRVKEW